MKETIKRNRIMNRIGGGLLLVVLVALSPFLAIFCGFIMLLPAIVIVGIARLFGGHPDMTSLGVLVLIATVAWFLKIDKEIGR